MKTDTQTPTTAATPVPKTRAEVEHLKQDWANDPIWDLADTKGYEAHREELLQFEAEYNKEKSEAFHRKEAVATTEAEKLGLTLAGLRRIEWIGQRIKRLEQAD
jgi:hypothetical protein